MSRSSLLVSLVLHAAILAFVGWSHSATTGHAGLGKTEIGVAFLPGDPGGLVMASDATPEPPAAQVTPPAYEPPASQARVIEVKPEPVAVTEFTPPPITTAATLPSDLPSAAPPTKSRSRSRTNAAASKGQTASSNPGRGEGGGGAIGAGTGGGGGSGYVPPQFLMRYKPLYPPEARAMKLQGVVMLLVSVDAEGRVTDARLSHSCGHQILDRAALNAVRSWRFLPARQSNQPISATVEIPIRFSLSA